MECCQADGIEKFMNTKVAARDLKRYQKNGPNKTTNLLIGALESEDVSGLTLLDIGGGVGALQHELLKKGLAKITSVDASSAYLEAALEEAKRNGYHDRLRQHHGDFVKIAEKIDKSDIVTLDRVICCYDDMESLVKLSVSRALKLYGVVYPTNQWWNRFFIYFGNLYQRIKRSQFRVFNHPMENIEEIIYKEGLERYFKHKTFFWHVHAFRRINMV